MNHFVEGPLRDPSSLKQTFHLGRSATPNLIGTIPGMDVHWGLVFGIVACLLCYLFQALHDVGLRPWR